MRWNAQNIGLTWSRKFEMLWKTTSEYLGVSVKEVSLSTMREHFRTPPVNQDELSV